MKTPALKISWFRNGILFLIILLSVIYSCNSDKSIVETPKQKFINPPFPELNPVFTSYSIDNQAGGVISFGTGTQITIPKDAYVDSLGNPIKGKIDINYREFHDAVSIMLSGISMKYDSAGQSYSLSTAGMFEIRATYNNKEAKIAKDKVLGVKLASYETQDIYNVYALDETKENWVLKGRDSLEINVTKKKDLELLTKKKSKLHNPYTEKQFAFNYNSILDIYYNDNYEKLIKNQKNPEPGNKASLYGLTWTNIYENMQVKFQGNYYPAALMVWKIVSNEDFPKWIDQSCGSTLKHIKNNTYRIELNKGKKKKFSANIELVMPLKSLFAFSPESWKTKYKENLEILTMEEERIKMSADVYRNFTINGNGIYNCDYVSKYPRHFAVHPTFDYGKKIEKMQDFDVFYILNNGKSLFSFKDIENVNLVEDSTARFLIILPDRTIATYSKEQFKQIDYNSLKAELNEFTFKMNISPKPNSEADIRKNLNI